MEDVKYRIKLFLKAKNMSVQNFEKAIGKTNGYLSHTTSPTAGVVATIAEVFPELCVEWLITGKGEMLKCNQEVNGGNNITVGGNASHVTNNDTSANERLFAMLEEKDRQLAEKDRQIAHLFDLLKEKSSFN